MSAIWIILDTQAKVSAAERAVYDLTRTLLPEQFDPEAQTYVGGGGQPPKSATVPTALVQWRKHPTLNLWAFLLDSPKPGAGVAKLMQYATGQLPANRYPDGVARSYEALLLVGSTYEQPTKAMDGSIVNVTRPNYFRGNRTQVQTQTRWDAMIAAVAVPNRVSPLPNDWNPTGP